MLNVTDDLIRNEAYLISRGTRPLSLLGHCEADEETMRLTMGRLSLQSQHYPTIVQFVVRVDKQHAAYGYATHRWVVQLYQWTLSAPDLQRERIEGLLFGYSPEAIQLNELRCPMT